MRGIILACAFAVITLFSVVVHINLQNGIQSLEQDMAQVAEALQRDDWNEAEELLTAIKQRWQRMQGFYALFARHQLYEPVAIGMNTLPKLIAEQETDAYAAALKLKEELHLLREAETFAWRNVL